MEVGGSRWKRVEAGGSGSPHVSLGGLWAGRQREICMGKSLSPSRGWGCDLGAALGPGRLQVPLLPGASPRPPLQGICGGGAWVQGLGELGRGGGGGEQGLLSPRAQGPRQASLQKQEASTEAIPSGRPCFRSRQSWIAGQAETLLALEDTHPGGHVAPETPGLDANPEHQEKLIALVALC